MKIAIIGASIAGLTAASALLKQDHQITIYEQYPEGLKNQGAGVVIPVELFNELKKQNIFSNNIPVIDVVKRIIVASDNNRGKTICEQNFPARALHWQTLYSQLKANVPDEHIKVQRVIDIDEIQKRENFDLLIGADGHNSLTAKTICGEIEAEYAGYIAWRGTAPLEDCITNGIFGPLNEGKAPYFVCHNGHCVMYLINEPETNRKLINWVHYEKRTGASLQNVLSMNSDTRQYRTILRGSLPPDQKQYLHAIIKILPKLAQDIITCTSEPFIQPVYTIQATQRINTQGNIIIIGDAASTLPPHTASGASKGITDALQIATAIKDDGLNGIKKWACIRLVEDQKLYALSNRMKDFLVLNTPDWRNMTIEIFEEIWAKVIAGESWYTSDVSKTLFAKPRL